MVKTLYIEEAVKPLHATQRILERYIDAVQVPIERYTEVFNRKGQNFRLQKQHSALILATKEKGHVLPCPSGYTIGDAHNFYFSHLLNCPFDCRYCFLQGMFRSAHYVLFVNYSDFQAAIARVIQQHEGESCTFFSGYDGDSLALEQVTHFAESFLPFFAQHPEAHFELRTKSLQIGALLRHPPQENTIIAYSLSPELVQKGWEKRTPPLQKRIEALVTLQEKGWPVGLRFDPILYCEDFKTQYKELFQRVFSVLSPERIHSVSLGPFRLPKVFHERLEKLYPDEPLLTLGMQEREGMVSYKAAREQEILSFCRQEIEKHIDANKVFQYTVPA